MNDVQMTRQQYKLLNKYIFNNDNFPLLLTNIL